jgi:hypothetical protein
MRTALGGMQTSRAAQCRDWARFVSEAWVHQPCAEAAEERVASEHGDFARGARVRLLGTDVLRQPRRGEAEHVDRHHEARKQLHRQRMHVVD